MVEIFCDGVDFEISQIQNYADWVFTQIGKDYELSTNFLNIILLSDNGLLEMNNEFLKHDYFTDIITFDLSESETEISGELYISLDRVIENSTLENCPLLTELQRVIVHGLLHLVGFEDGTVEDKKEMQLLENQYINQYVSRETII